MLSNIHLELLKNHSIRVPGGNSRDIFLFFLVIEQYNLSITKQKEGRHMNNTTTYHAGLYYRLSKDDEQHGESVSIGTQRSILTDYCLDHGFEIVKEYVDDGYSGLNFNRPGFLELRDDIESGKINLVITKDLSRLGRDYITTGYYLEFFFPAKDVRYIAIADGFDSLKSNNEIAPFKNILNDMYARDISRKVKNAKHQRAKKGCVIASQAPYGYRRNEDGSSLIIDPEAAETVRKIYSMALKGDGDVAIATALSCEGIEAPSYYLFQRGDTRFAGYKTVKDNQPYQWSYGSVNKILNDPVYIGTLTNLKTEVINCKTKQRVRVPESERFVFPDAHEAIISKDTFEKVQQIRATHRCPAKHRRDNLFRDLLFCDCCGHPLTISRKQLKYREADIYLCAYHNRHPEVCPKTHIIYHEMLYPYVLDQVRTFARSMKRRKVNSPISEYAAIQELTSEILKNAIERIEIGHVNYKSRPGSVIHIYWKLN